MVTTTMQHSTHLQALPDDYLRRVDLRRMYPDKKGNPVMVHCPVHGDTGKPNLAVYPRNVYCFHPNCSYRDGVFGYVRRVKGLQTREAVLRYVQSLLSEDLIVQEDDISSQAPLPPLDNEVAQEYRRNMRESHYKQLERRYGLTQPTVQGARIGYTGTFPYAFTLPVYDIEGELVNIRYRADPVVMDEKGLKYWGMKGRNQTTLYIPPRLLTLPGKTLRDKVAEWHSGVFVRKPWVFITEGEFDALALEQMGYVAVAVTNGAKAFLHHSDELAHELRGLGVMVCFDQDPAGREGRIHALRALMLEGVECRSVEWDPREGKDAAEVLRRHRDNYWLDRNARFLKTRLAPEAGPTLAAIEGGLTS